MINSSVQIMGIINLTPDSFYPASRSTQLADTIDKAMAMQANGADIIDIGGASSRPGATAVSEQQELERVIPIISELAKRLSIPISVDTYQPAVMAQAVASGATMINDIQALRVPGALTTAAQLKVKVCLMHMQGCPQTMQSNPVYQDVVGEVMAFLGQRIIACEEAGISRANLLIDPGFGFGKTKEHNLKLLGHLREFAQLQCPILVGLSRKSMFGQLCQSGSDVNQRLPASLAAAIFAYLQGAKVLRVHDVLATKQALQVVEAVQSSASLA